MPSHHDIMAPGPARPDPWCFVLFASRPADEISLRDWSTSILQRNGALFMSADPARAGDLLRLAAARSDYSGAVQAAIGAGWLQYRVPYTNNAVTRLAAAAHVGDVWAAVVYSHIRPTYGRPKLNRGQVSTGRMDARWPDPPVVFYGTTPASHPYQSVPLSEAGEKAVVFFPVLIAANCM